MRFRPQPSRPYAVFGSRRALPLQEKDKSDRAARKKQKTIVVKEVKFSVTVDEHDYQTKKNQAIRFLGEGDKVKASLRFKGRQMAHRELGYAIINRLIQDMGDVGIVEFMPRMEGTTLHAILAPGKKAETPKKPAPPNPLRPESPRSNRRKSSPKGLRGRILSGRRSGVSGLDPISKKQLKRFPGKCAQARYRGRSFRRRNIALR